MTELPPIVGSTVPEAWSAGFVRLMQAGVHELTPLLVTVTDVGRLGCEPNPPTRQELDTLLQSLGKHTTNTVANTVFPQSLWNLKRERSLLYDRYIRHVLPAVRSENPHGTYFQRMIQFGGCEAPVNQLEQVITTWLEHGNHRHSALQLSIFDPRHDHKHNRRLGFPCLHQVCFTPLGQNGSEGFAVTGFYATQHLVPKAYENYLGLIRLGHFVAHALGLRLTRMTCFAAKAVLGDGITKELVDPLYKTLSKRQGESREL
jgi:hypothetical protein